LTGEEGRVVTDQEFAALVAQRSARIPGVVAVTLGGSRAQGDYGPDSDWDFGLYYRGRLNPEDVAALGFTPGKWGGAWLQVDGRRVDLHYRDLDDVEHWLAEAQVGRFRVERRPFYLAGIPTYVVVGELAVAQVLLGELPRPGFPVSLREAASSFWQAAAELSLDYADTVYAPRGDALGCAGSLARAVIEAAHARLAAKGAWALNEKRIVQRAGLGHLASRFAHLGRTPTQLHHAVQTLTETLTRPTA
jgi:predicted nucleotidyltransferase